MNLFQTSSGKRIKLMRHFVYAQVAVQVGIALTPFWSNTVYAAISSSQDDNYYTGAASTLGSFGQAAQQGNLSGAAAQQATGIASQQAQNWLQQFGTARIELNTDGNFKPRTGAADLLIPLYKSDDRLLFTQNGIRNVDGQFTGNFGVGQRHFVDSWMFGYNAFYDQNFSRGHKRIGTGVEAWRDYMKLSGNGYWRVSGWKNSGDVEDYDARPANGFDLRAEAWLPAYAALGGRLMYEKYYGDEVALFGKDKRQKNPDAITAGLSYTPVPLISFTADHKRGGSQNDTRFGLQLTYQLGQSLSSHFDTSAVNQKRTLSGSGMDLVERNNNIVLEYRKQQLIDLVLPAEITGESGKTVPVTYQLTSKYGLAKIVWNDAAVTAAGGKMQDLGGGKYQLVMPKYTAGALNRHTLSGVAYDNRNNVSKLATTTVTVTRPSVSAANSNVAATPGTILADGASTSLIVFTLNDESGAPVTGLAADIALALKEERANTPLSKAGAKAKAGALPARPATLSDVTEQGSGVYHVTLTAGTRPMLAVLNASLGALVLPGVAINQISDAASATVREGDLTLVTDNAVANASAANRVQARVTDATGNPVAGVAVTFSLSGSAQVASGSGLTALSDHNGYASVQFISSVAETVSVTATTAVGGSARVNATFIADKASAALDSNDLTVDRISAVANGSDKVTFTALIKDANGNPVPDMPINWSANGGSLADSSSVSGADGRATITLSNTVAQIVQASASVAGGASVIAPQVSFGADAASGGIGQNDLTVSKNTATANGSDGITYTVVVKDANGNPLAGQTVSWLTTTGYLSAASSDTDVSGQATIILTSLQAAQAQVTAGLSGKPPVNAPQVSFTADASSANIASGDLTVDKPQIIGNNADAATFTAVVKDANGNPVANQPVSWSTDRGSLSAGTSDTNDRGEATIRLTGTLAGIARVTAAVNGSAAVNAPEVTVTSDSSSAQIGSDDLSADKATALANGTETVTYTAAVKDASGNPVPDLVVSWGTDLGNLSAPTSTTAADGTASMTLTSAVTGHAIVTARPGSGSLVSASAVGFVADGSTAHIGSGDLTVDKTTVLANNADAATYTALVKDANGNPVEGFSVSWGTTAGTLSNPSSSTGPDGKATMALRHIKAEQATVTATVNGAGTGADAVTFIADVTTAKVDSVISDKAKITGTGEETATLTATVTDANGNPVAGFTPDWNSTLGTVNGNGATDGNGTVTATLTAPVHVATTNGTATVNASGKSGNVTVRAVLEAGGKYFWTMRTDHNTSVESTAAANCQAYGSGIVADRINFEQFRTNGGDFNNMKITGEYPDVRYFIASEWSSSNFGDWNSAGSPINIYSGNELPREAYVCVK